MILGFVSHAAAKFSLLKNNNIKSNFYDSNNKPKKKTDLDSSLLLKPSEHLKHLVNQFNMSSHPNEINSDYPENTVSFK